MNKIPCRNTSCFNFLDTSYEQILLGQQTISLSLIFFRGDFQNHCFRANGSDCVVGCLYSYKQLRAIEEVQVRKDLIWNV